MPYWFGVCRNCASDAFAFEVTGVDKARFISVCAAFCHISTLSFKVSRSMNQNLIVELPSSNVNNFLPAQQGSDPNLDNDW